MHLELSLKLFEHPYNLCARDFCQVFCALCSSLKFRLTHLDGKEGRVCVSCHSTLIKSKPKRIILIFLNE